MHTRNEPAVVQDGARGPVRAVSKMTRAALSLGLGLLASPLFLAPAHAAGDAASCPKLATARIADTTISAAQTLNAGSWTPPGSTTPVTLAVAVCRVVGVVSTKPGEQVGIEVWLPLSGWNGRFEGLGSGGFGGSINYGALAAASARGFAAANTDTGHVGGTVGAIGEPLPWVQNHVTLVDWGHSSVHLMTRSAKAILRTFYQQGADYAYFDGCSTGGAEAMEEAEFYPEDYSGIHAGSPGMDYSHLMESFLWGGLLPAQNKAATLDITALTLLNTAVLQNCGGAGAVQAGYLLDPRRCNFNPAELQCPGSMTSNNCLSAPQVAEAQRLYAPVTDPRTGLHLYPGFARGSESQWGGIQGALVPFYAQPLLANAVFKDPNWDWTSFDFDKDAALLDRVLSPYINATTPDLSQFQGHGGKLLMTQGWADALNAQTLPIEYFNSVVQVVFSLDRVRDFFELYMAPGMSHCGGGPGPNTIGGSAPPTKVTPERDVLAALQAWVEEDRAPGSLISTKYVNDTPPAVSREIKLCPYPEVAELSPHADPTKAASYTCALDARGYAADSRQEAHQIATDVAIGDLANLPN